MKGANGRESTANESPAAIARAYRRELAFERAESALANAIRVCEQARKSLATAKAALEASRRTRAR